MSGWYAAQHDFLEKVPGGHLQNQRSKIVSRPLERRPFSTLRKTVRNSTTGVRQAIERLGPYQSIVLLAVPTCLIEPLKLVAVAIAGEGHWITGTAMIIAAYAGSLFVVERLFRIVKPKLMTLSWFAKLWAKIMIARGKVIGLFRRT
jgi:hypothetical protein